MKKSLLALTLTMLISCSQQTSEQHLQSAKAYLEQDNIEAAVVELKNAVKLDPQSAEARFELGKAYLAKKQFESAEKELNRALDYGYPAAQVIPLLSKAYKNTGAYAALSEVEHDMAGLSPVEQAEVGYSKLQSLIALEKYEEATTLIAEIEALDTKSVYRGLASVFTPIIEQDYATAAEQISALREQAPRNEDILKLQAQVLLRQNRTDDAINVYQDYIELNPEDVQIKFVVAKLMVDQNRVAEAEPLIDELLGINADNPLLNQLKATVSAGQNNFAEAQEYAEKAILLGRTEPSLRLVAGYAAYQQQDYQGTQRHLSFIASTLPDKHPALKMLAVAQLQLGQTEEASDVLDRVDEDSAQDALLFSKTGYELIRSGNFKEAQEFVEKSEKLSRSAEDLTRLGVLKLSLNNVEGILNLEQAVEKAPELKSAKSTLATAYLATKQWQKAKDLANEWMAASPDEVEPYLLLAEVQLIEDQFNDARATLQEALDKEPQNGMVHLALARLDINQGNLDSALQRVEGILSKAPDFIPAISSYYQIKTQMGDPEGGKQAALNALNSNPDNPSYILLVAKMHFTEQKYDQAVNLLNRIEEDHTTPKQYWLIKGQALLRSNNVSAAETHYQNWLAIHPHQKDAVLGSLLLLDNQREFNKAVETAKAFLDVRDDNQIKMLLTHFYTMVGDYEAAQKQFDALPEALTKTPLMRAAHARLLIADKQPQQALSHSEFAYEKNPTTRNLVLYLANLEMMDRHSEGLQLLKNHIDKNQRDVAAMMLLAERQINNDAEGAIETYEASIAINPNNFVVLNNLAYLHLQKGNLDKAKEHAHKAVDLSPQNAAALDTLAQVYVAEKAYDSAIGYYERAVDDDMQNEEIYLNYVETLLAAERMRLAERKLGQREFKLEASLKRIEELKSKYGI